jgi:hypothetical protein
MNLLDTVAVTSRSFSKNEGLVNALKAKYSKVISMTQEQRFKDKS